MGCRDAGSEAKCLVFIHGLSISPSNMLDMSVHRAQGFLSANRLMFLHNVTLHHPQMTIPYAGGALAPDVQFDIAWSLA